MLRKPYILNLKSFDAGNDKGILTFAEGLDDIPFTFSRVFFTYNVETRSRGRQCDSGFFE